MRSADEPARRAPFVPFSSLACGLVRCRRGIALPLMLFLIVLLTVLAAGALTVSGVERRTLGMTAVRTDADALAQAGLERFVADRASLGFTAIPPAAAESARIAFPDGYADVVLSRLREARALEPALYVIRSRGVRTDGSASRAPIAQRTIAQLARWQEPAMQVLAGWTSLRGVVWANAAGTVEGGDACHAAPAVAGAAVPTTPGFVQTHGPPVPRGSPHTLDLGSAAQAPNEIAIDWAAIAGGSFAGATVNSPADPWPTTAQWADPSFWPVIVVEGDLTLPTDGRGLLAVTGNLAILGHRNWDGVILVGGSVTERTGNTISGALVSGLNVKLGAPAAPSDSVRGNFRVLYHSCNIARALAAFAGLHPFRNATMDNWPR